MNELIFLAVGQGQAQPQMGCLEGMLPILLMLPIFYFLLIRPQQKQRREFQAMIARLKKGDRVIAGGGLIGTITEVADSELEVQIADKVKVRVLRTQVQLYGAADAGGTAEKKDEK